MSSWLIGVAVLLAVAVVAVVIAVAFFGWVFWKQWLHRRDVRPQP
jgi:hypothetical protein